MLDTFKLRDLHDISPSCNEMEGVAHRIDTQMGMHIENSRSNPCTSHVHLCDLFIRSRVKVDPNSLDETPVR